ncbi:hypothetical protein ACFX1X_042315 [Malus domestica]
MSRKASRIMVMYISSDNHSFARQRLEWPRADLFGSDDPNSLEDMLRKGFSTALETVSTPKPHNMNPYFTFATFLQLQGNQLQLLSLNLSLPGSEIHNKVLEITMKVPGKTTIAIAVYDEIACRFEACCFLENIKEGFMKQGKLHMQAELLSSISNNKEGSSDISKKGFQVILSSLGQRKVLIVMDDVDALEQIEALLGGQRNKKRLCNRNSGYNPHAGIRVLRDRALITVSWEGELEMHDLLAEMGWEIVRQESIEERGRRSRLWSYEDVHHVLTQNKATEAVESIILNLWNSDEVCLNAEGSVIMTQLRLLKITQNRYCKQHLIGHLKFLSRELRCLSWIGSPRPGNS